MTLQKHNLGRTTFPLSGWIEGFILSAEAAGLSSRTVSFYRNNLRRFCWWCDQQGYEELQALEPHALRLFIRYLQTSQQRWGCDTQPATQKRLAPASVHAYVRALKAFCTWLVEEGALDVTPFERVKTPLVPSKQPTPLTDEELNALLQSCKLARVSGSPYSGKLAAAGLRWAETAEMHSARDLALVLTLVDSLLRVSELLSIQRKTITPSGAFTVLGKGRKERMVQVSQETRRALWKYERLRTDAHEALWVGTRGPLGKEGIEDILEDRSRMAGIRHVNPHLLRHTGAVRFLRNGGDPLTLMRLLGHTSLDMTKRYVKLADTDIAESHRKHSPLKGLRW